MSGVSATVVLTALAVLVPVLAALAALAAHSVLVAPWDVRCTAVDAPIAGLPAAFDGYTIALLADLHHRPRLSRRATRRAIEMARASAPDLVVLLGDLAVSYQRARWRSRVMYERAMRELSPPLAALARDHRVVAVLGNHDYYYSAEGTRGWLASLGVRVLVNECLRVERDGVVLAVGGVDDALEGRVDPDAGGAGASGDVPAIVLSHNPDGVLQIAPRRRVDLVLAGHTHGGQVRLPWLGALVTRSTVCRRHTASGWVPNPRAPLYVSRGVGGVIPLRFNCPPEVVVVRLVPAR